MRYSDEHEPKEVELDALAYTATAFEIGSARSHLFVIQLKFCSLRILVTYLQTPASLHAWFIVRGLFPARWITFLKEVCVTSTLGGLEGCKILRPTARG